MVTAISLYKKYRIPHVGRYAGTGKLYFHQVIAKSAWENAVRNAEIINKWEQLEDDGKVRLKIEPDESADFDDLCGDSFNPKVNPEISYNNLMLQKSHFRDKVNQEGVWGIVGEYYNGEKWIHADSVWGFVGDDWKESGYDLDVKWETIRQYEELEFCPCCHRPKVK